MINTDKKAIDNLLNQGVAEVIVKDDLKKKLYSGKKLRIKLGIDPTGFDLHLGHMVVVHKLAEFQRLGHQIILLFGNFTGQIGDPTGKSEVRTMKTQKELEANAKHYIDQVSSILDVKKIEVAWNADWLAPLNFSDVIKLASNFTVMQMLERDMFQNRIKKGAPISMHEFMYPLMQGYDSVALKADVELGGTDQTFNLLAGRVLQKAYGQEPQNILTVPILVGTDGVMKMGKTTGNYIGVMEDPKDVLGKTMSIPDSMIETYLGLAARCPKEEVELYKSRLEKGENPRTIKMELAKKIVSLYFDEKTAAKAEEEFNSLFQKKNIPDEIEEKKISHKEIGLIDLLFETGMAESKSEARRLIQGGAVKVNQEKVEDIDSGVKIPKEGVLIQAGKRKFLRVFSK